MLKEVVMPKLGITMSEGIISKWKIKEGDSVEKGMPIMEVESDKSLIEIESQYTGVLERIIRKEGEIVPVGGIVAIIKSGV